MTDQQYTELRDEIRELHREQRRLRDQQERLSASSHAGHDAESGNGSRHSQGDGAHDSPPATETPDAPAGETPREDDREKPRRSRRQRMREFAAGHPLGVILGRTEMLTELISTSASKESVTAQIDHIRDATRRLTSMVDHLISDAMADAFDITIRREPVDVAALASDVAEANQPLAHNKQQTITVSAPPNIVTMCDTDRIREAIDNLVSNAIKYSPIGGKISVTVSHEDDNTIIRVADEGAGLSPEDLGRLFGRFQRLSAKPTAGESSTGLGLSIVKRIIDMHGGEVTARSDGPGQGSTFTIVLPATEMS